MTQADKRYKKWPLGAKLFVYATVEFGTIDKTRKMFRIPITPMEVYYIGYKRRAVGKVIKEKIDNDSWLSDMFGTTKYRNVFKPDHYVTVLQVREKAGSKIIEVLPEDADLASDVNKEITEKMNELDATGLPPESNEPIQLDLFGNII